MNARRGWATVTQVILVIVALIAWQFLPRVGWLETRSHLFDPFFVSSPSAVARTLADLAVGRNGTVLVWPYVWQTLAAAIIGILVGMVAGGAFGLLLSNFAFLSMVVHPFVVAVNAVPRIALIPIIIILVGPTFGASVVIALIVVFFVAFFNAYEGGRNVTPQLLQNARILGANPAQIMWHVRSPYVLAWTLAALPLATTFAVISVVTGEILTGYPGLGRLISVAEVTADSSLTFAVVVVMSVMGMVVVGIAQLVKTRVLHWWVSS